MSRTLAELLNSSDLAGKQVQADMQAGLVSLALLSAHGPRAPETIQQQLQDLVEYLEARQPSDPNDVSDPLAVSSARPASAAPYPLHTVLERTTQSVIYSAWIHTIGKYLISTSRTRGGSSWDGRWKGKMFWLGSWWMIRVVWYHAQKAIQ
ncbi:hypothetical protein B0H13DRAFT_1867917 [Mycena leptocephala]|nr:hypothetical protein B0H13DRAFT_1867917 [Mycena leptocephala]